MVKNNNTVSKKAPKSIEGPKAAKATEITTKTKPQKKNSFMKKAGKVPRSAIVSKGKKSVSMKAKKAAGSGSSGVKKPFKFKAGSVKVRASESLAAKFMVPPPHPSQPVMVVLSTSWASIKALKAKKK